jgi:hypothetical protein
MAASAAIAAVLAVFATNYQPADLPSPQEFCAGDGLAI